MTNSCSNQAPVACSLGADDYRDRLTWIEVLTRKALRSQARDDLVLRLVYAPDAAPEVCKMVQQERICCAFLSFDLRHESDAVTLTITLPEAMRDSADRLFEPFLAETAHVAATT